MISVVITKQNNKYCNVSLDGHAGFADSGQDIVCAAVSVLVINTFNSIEQFTEDDFTCETAEDGGHLVMSFPGDISDKSILLLDAMLLGLENIQQQYGDEYLSLLYKEV
ncbi:MAG: ribosomal-processing cysteine protease Prp [Pseudobutyrivibrio sp.]|nr:ribosomal-processing cysteine protease Prp [Pseudobutyrivibrio sp.]